MTVESVRSPKVFGLLARNHKNGPSNHGAIAMFTQQSSPREQSEVLLRMRHYFRMEDLNPHCLVETVHPCRVSHFPLSTLSPNHKPFPGSTL
jgi:hypothetical protein